MHRGVIATGSLVLVLLIGGCGSTPPAEGQGGAGADDNLDRTALAAAVGAADEETVRERPDGIDDPERLRTTLERLLGHHATLTASLMRAAVAGTPDFPDLAVAALSWNTDDLTVALEPVLGADDAEAFREMWADYVRSLFSYARGVAEEDDALRDRARAELDDGRGDLAEFLAAASAGSLAAEEISEALSTHIDLLLDQVDAYAAGEHAEAFASQRDAYARMWSVGAAVAAGIGEGHVVAAPAANVGAPQELRSALGRLLGDHAELEVAAMRAGAAGTEDAGAALAALDANTEDLTAAMEALFGVGAAQRFHGLWTGHTVLLTDYAAAVAADDREAMDDARAGLADDYGPIAAFFEEATAGGVAADTVNTGMQQHTERLMDQVEAFAAGDYATAHRVAYDAHFEIFDTAVVLASGVESFLGDRLPEGAAPTGLGGAATDPD